MPLPDVSARDRRAICRDCGTPLTFAYNQLDARIYVTIGSLDAPESAPTEIQYGVESRLPWVDFCENVPTHRTGGTPETDAFFAGMINYQL